MSKTSRSTFVRGTRRYFIYFFLSIVLIVLTVSASFEIIKRTDLLKLEKVSIDGESERLNYHLEQDLSAYFGINLYRLDLELLSDSLKTRYPIISEIDIKRRILSSLKVKYLMEKPFAIVNFTDGKNYYTTKELKILERVNYGYLKRSLPIITTKLKSSDFKIGSVISDSLTMKMNDYLLEVLQVRQDFQEKISDVFIIDNKVYFREILRGNIVYFGKDNISEKIDLFLSYNNSFTSGLYIDLSYKDQIVTRKADF